MPVRRSFASDDRGLAGAVGVVLMIAVAITLYADAVRSDIPVYGTNAEREWDAEISGVLRQLGRSTGQGLEEGAPVVALLPPPPVPSAVEMPFIGRTEPATPSGTVAFDPDCASFRATHQIEDGSIVQDLSGGSTGCLRFDATTTYVPQFGYVMEFGGLLRVQGDGAFVVAGPPLDAKRAGPHEHRITLGLPGMRGIATSASNDAASVRVDMVPGPASREIEPSTNARDARWELDTQYPQAWRAWFESRLQMSGLVASRAAPTPGESAADFAVSCMPVDCSVGGSGRGTVIVELHGPRDDAADIRLALTYGLYDVSVH